LIRAIHKGCDSDRIHPRKAPIRDRVAALLLKPLQEQGFLCAATALDACKNTRAERRKVNPNGAGTSPRTRNVTGLQWRPPQPAPESKSPAKAGLFERECVGLTYQAEAVAPSALIRLTRRETRREAVFLCTMPFCEARMISGCAACIA
jgi:hypothetical protein